MDEKKNVLVLMSTYNGEKYLREQLDSILKSTGVEVAILVRDDGSTDSTVEILEEYTSTGKLSFYIGENVGPAQSFRELVETCNENYFAYAYADQDDIWSKNKLFEAVSDISKVEKRKKEPILWYCGIEEFCDNQVLRYYSCPIDRARDIKTVLMTFATTNGCTMVFNGELLSKLRECILGKIDMHDSWTNAVCLAAGGKVISSDKKLVKYRIHANQVLGGRKKKSIKKLLNPSKLRGETVRLILKSQLVKKEYLALFYLFANSVSISNKYKLLFSRKPQTMTRREFLDFKLKILLNAY